MVQSVMGPHGSNGTAAGLTLEAGRRQTRKCEEGRNERSISMSSEGVRCRAWYAWRRLTGIEERFCGIAQQQWLFGSGRRRTSVPAKREGDLRPQASRSDRGRGCDAFEDTSAERVEAVTWP